MIDAERQLKRKLIELLSIFNVIKDLHLDLELSVDQTIEVFSRSVAGLFLIKKVAIFVLEKEDKESFLYLFQDGNLTKSDSSSKIKSRINDIQQEITEKEDGVIFVSDMKEGEAKEMLTAMEMELVVPLFLRKELKGVYFIGKKFTGEPYTDEDRMFLYSCANQFIVTLENNSLYQLLQRHMEELTVLNEVTTAINFGLDTEVLLNIVLEILLEMLGAYSGFIMIFKEKNIRDTLFFINRGLDDTKKNILLNVKGDKGLMGKALASNETIYIKQEDSHDPSEDKLYFDDSGNPGYWICKPLFIREENKIGVLALAKRANEPFNKEYQDLYTTLTNQLLMIVLNARLYELSITDSLTGLFVHRYFEQRLREEISRARRYFSKVSIIMMDIDHFKQANDLFGHQTGNIILKKIALVIKLSIRKDEDIPTRWGGDELAIVLPETGKDGACVLADRIRKNIENFNFMELDKKLKITVSLGVSSFPVDALDENELVRKADEALYQSKSKGGNMVCSS
ncbi:MAG: diguanylate cyclase [Candidatus Omnitrophota bacterium]|jgi:diguanylate cyclase (GGDEF)-like protein